MMTAATLLEMIWPFLSRTTSQGCVGASAMAGLIIRLPGASDVLIRFLETAYHKCSPDPSTKSAEMPYWLAPSPMQGNVCAA